MYMNQNFKVELTKGTEKLIRSLVSKHTANGLHTQEYKICELCAIIFLLEEIDRLREENIKLRVNP